MLTLQISEEQLQKALEDVLIKVFAVDNYNNPMKKLVENAVGTSYSKGTMTAQIEEKITAKIQQFMETPGFDMLLGQAVAAAIAEREIAKKK